MEENRRILVVDDDPGVRDAFKEILLPTADIGFAERGAALFGDAALPPSSCSLQQYELTMAVNGDKGIEAVEKSVLQRRPFAAAFIDMNMAGLDGAETARRIWRLDPQISIVIVTAFSEYRPCDIIDIVQRDDIFYLRKPFNSEEIRQFAKALTQFWNTEREKEALAARLEVANAKLADMNRNLEKKVKEQAALLIQSEKMSSLGVLAAGVAHEINNPICFVHGNLDAIQKYSAAIKKLLIHYEALEEAAGRSEGDALRPLIQAIDEFKAGHKIDFILADIVNLANESLEGTRRVRDIVKELRGFSHVDEAERQPTGINLTIDKTLTMMAAGLRPDTEIVKTYGSLPMVSGYPQKLSQVFLNVLMNAAQAVSDNGRIEIATRLLPSDKGDARPIAEIRVTDNGHGIQEGALSKVFDPFFTTKPAGEGTGLGLSISYEIVKLHGGDIILEGTGRAGTTVRILLPVDSVPKVS